MPLTFHRKPALVAYVTSGDPDLATTRAIILAAIDAIDGPGFYRIGWDAMGREDGEAKLRERAYTVRCLVTENGEVPSPEQDDGLIAYVAKAY